ncbi:MaoC family dehydratase N-terminal domain-containing protein [Alisedimentitalea sp. MJ-SS2]|uniref:FAS1-like dehydratase domain-containing protein n=1 Tax=Aliisedimentitalea sp. MJ-SS2 TaxID=3049795 RepID=UPI00290B39C7|nr:MaoC family dehydratase N-terminal domain-containing protein [Alisedimentitalea sp. MJ-SS2]MDU8928005.1 MaoC family dehydratase N-terminal domain-containing protein [Alisedimentitalea sp. MJ-SS2]
MARFNRDSEGQVSAPVPVDVERGALVFFSETIGETNPIYVNPGAARAAGYPDVVAPATYAVVLDMAAAHETRRTGGTDILTRIGADMRRLLHGNEAYEYHGPIFAGDRVTLSTRVRGFSDAKGGKLEFAHLETTITHKERGPLVTVRRDLIHRLG